MAFGYHKSEDPLKRKSYYGFARNYPGTVGGSKYMIGESRTVHRREVVRRILIILALIALFVASFTITEICLNISEKPKQIQMSDFRLQTSDFRLQTSDFRLQTSDFRLQTSDFRLQTSDVRLQTSDVRCQMSDVRLQMSDIRY